MNLTVILRLLSITVAALIAAVMVAAACREADSDHVLNPGGNVVPPGPSPVVEETHAVRG